MSKSSYFRRQRVWHKLGVSSAAVYLLLKGKTFKNVVGVGLDAEQVVHNRADCQDNFSSSHEETVSALDLNLDDETIKKLEAPHVPHIRTGAF